MIFGRIQTDRQETNIYVHSATEKWTSARAEEGGFGFGAVLVIIIQHPDDGDPIASSSWSVSGD